jgi:dihydrofolate reductase
MKAIVAMSSGRVIGYNGKLPWPSIKEDMRWFKWVTMGLSYERALYLSQFPLGVPEEYELTNYREGVIVGNQTYKTIGILPERDNYVITNAQSKLSSRLVDGMVYATVQYILSMQSASYLWDHLWVIGGAKTYQIFLPYCDEVLVTHIIGDFMGDTHMPEFERKFPNQEILKESKDYWIVRYFK